MSKWSNPDCKVREERKILATTHRINVAEATAAAAKEVVGKPLRIANGIHYTFNGWSSFCELSITGSVAKIPAIKESLGRKYFLSSALSSRLMFFKMNSYPTLTLIESEVNAGDIILISLRECPQNVDLLLTYLMPPRDIITKWSPEELDWRPRKDGNPWDVDSALVKPLSSVGMSYLGKILTESLTGNTQEQQPQSTGTTTLNQQKTGQQKQGQLPLCCRVAGIIYTLSIVTRLPENISTNFAEAHTKHIVEIFDAVAGDPTLVVLVGHCLHVFANSAPDQFYWRSPELGLRERIATQPEAGKKPHKDACTCATNAAVEAGVFKTFIKIMRTFYIHNTDRIRNLAADTLGALVHDNEKAGQCFWNNSVLVDTIRSALGWATTTSKHASVPIDSNQPPQYSLQPISHTKSTIASPTNIRSISSVKSTSALRINPQQPINVQANQVREEVNLRITLIRALAEAGNSSKENRAFLDKFGLMESAVDTVLWGFSTVAKPTVNSPMQSGGPRRAAPLPPQQCYAEHADELASEQDRETLTKAPKDHPLLMTLISKMTTALGAIGSPEYDVFHLFARVFDPTFRATSENTKARARFNDSSIMQDYFLEHLICQRQGKCFPEETPSVKAAAQVLFTNLFVGKCDAKLRRLIVLTLCALARCTPPPQTYLTLFNCVIDYMVHNKGESCIFCADATVVLLTAYAADMTVGGAPPGLLEFLDFSRKIVSEGCSKEDRKDARFKRIQKAYVTQASRVLGSPCAFKAMIDGGSTYNALFNFLRDPELFDVWNEAIVKLSDTSKSQSRDLHNIYTKYMDVLNTDTTIIRSKEFISSTLKSIRDICALGQDQATLIAETPVYTYILGCGAKVYEKRPSANAAFLAVSDLLRTLFCLLSSAKKVEGIPAFEEHLGYKRLTAFIRRFFTYEKAAGSTEYEAEVMGYLFNFMCNDTSPTSSLLPPLSKPSQTLSTSLLKVATQTSSLSPLKSTQSTLSPLSSPVTVPSPVATPKIFGVPDIVNPSVLLVIIDLLTDLGSKEAVTFVLYKLSYVIQSPRNKAVCCHRSLDAIRRFLVLICTWGKTNGLEKSNLEWDPSYAEMNFDPVITPKLVGVVQALGCHNLSPRDLHFIMRILACTDPKTKCRLRVFPYLIDALRTVAATSQTTLSASLQLQQTPSSQQVQQQQQQAATEPHSFYEFTQGKMSVATATSGGETGSGIILPSVEKNPFQKGFTFTAWVRVDRCGVGEYKPRIFRLSGNEEVGIELYLTDSFFAFRMVTQNEDESFSFSKFVVVERRWMFLSLTISTSLLKSSEIRLYIDGALTERTHITYPRLPSCTMNSIGCALSRRDDKLVPTQSFSGQIASANFFDDALTQAQIQQIYGVGPNYLGLFTEADFPNNTGVYFGNSLVMGFNCYSLEGDYPINIRIPPTADDPAGSNAGNTSNESDAPADGNKPEFKTENLATTGRLLNVVPCFTTNIKETIDCVEGIGVLFPLLLTLTKPPPKLDQCDEETLLRSEQDLLINIVDLIHFTVIGSKELEDDMLQKQGYAMLGHFLKKVPPKLFTPRFVRSLSERYVQLARNKPLQDAFFWDLAMDFTLWTYTPCETQRELIKTFAGNSRVTVRHLFTIIQMFYWNESQRTLKPTLLCKEGPRPKDEELSVLRGDILGILHRKVESGVPLSAADGDAAVNFLLETDDDVILSEVLVIYAGVLENSNTDSGPIVATTEVLLDRGILGCLLDILRKSSPGVCLLSVRIIFRFMFTLKTRHRFSYDAVLVALTQALLANPNNIELTASLYIVLQGAVSEQHPGVFCACILPLISHSSRAVRMLIMKDLSAFVKCGEGAAALLDYPGWYASLCGALSSPPFSEQPGETAYRDTVVSLAGSIGSDLVIYSILSPRFSWATVEPFFAALRVSAAENELVQECELKIFEEVANAIIALIDDREGTSAAQPSSPEGTTSPLSSPPLAVLPTQPQSAMSRTTQAKSVMKKQGIAPFITPLLYIVDFFFVHAPSQIKFYGSMSSNVLLQAYISLEPNEAKRIKAERLILPRILMGIECLCHSKIPANWGSAKTSALVKYRSGGLAYLSVTLALRIVQLIIIDSKAISEEADSYTNFKASIACIKQVAEDNIATLSSLSAAGTKSSDVFFFILNTIISSYKISVCTYPGELCNTLCNIVFDFLSRFMLKSKDEKKTLTKGGDAEREIYRVASLEHKNSNTLSTAIADPKWVAVKKKLLQKALPYFMSFEEDSNKVRSAFGVAIQTAKTQMSSPIAQAVIAHASSIQKNDQTTTVSITSETEINAMITAEKERLSNFRQDTIDANFAGSGAWLRNLRTVTSGKGIWGTEETYDKWKLDKTESGTRMRLKLKRNHNFDAHEGMAHTHGKSTKPGARTSSSGFSHTNDAGVQSPEMLKISLPKGSWLQGDGTADDDLDLLDIQQQQQQQQQEQTAPVNPEKAIFEIKCELVKPGKIIKGSLTLYMQKIVFKETREDSASDGANENTTQTNYMDKIWNVNEVNEVHMRRFLLVRTALEVFFADKTNYFLNFETTRLMSTVYSKIVNTLKPPNLAFANTHSPAEILRKSGLTRRWMNREISNFDYIMHLNTIAGRTYNDLRQYPVFPWVIADYTSESIDLNNPETYRDLSKPMGALNPKRLEGFLDRYKNFMDDTPPFMYATHYSSADIVFYYLIRTEPFTSYFLDLQKKLDLADRMFYCIEDTWKCCNTSPYDVKELIPEFFYFPDFLRNANGFDLGKKQNGEVLNDVVLPPWAHGSPEEFIRINREALESEYVSSHLHEWIDLIFGYKQRGKAAIDADNVFCYFTYEGGVNLDKITDVHEKEAMKSRIANFGQTPSQLLTKPHPARGKPKLEMLPFCQSSIEPKSWAFEVSSTPIAYAKLGSERLVTVDKAQTVRAYRFGLNNQNFSLDPMNLGKFSLGMRFAPHVQHQRHNLFAVTKDVKYLFASGFWDKSIKTYSLDTGRPVQTLTYHRDVVTCISYSGNTLVTGSRDTTVMVWDVFIQTNSSAISSNSGSSSTAQTQSVQGSQSSNTGMNDATINRSMSNGSSTAVSANLLGDDQSATSGQSSGDGLSAQAIPGSPIVQATSVATSSSVVNANSGVATLRVTERPRHILYGHDEEVCALDANANLDIVVSGATDGSIAVHTLRGGHFCWSAKLRSGDSGAGSPPPPQASIIRITPRSGNVLVYSAEPHMLSLFSVNGRLLKNRKVDHKIYDVCVCSDERFIIVSYKDTNIISVHYLHSLELVSDYNLGANTSNIRSMSLLPESERVLVTGMTDGSIVVTAREEGLRQKKGWKKGATETLKYIIQSTTQLSANKEDVKTEGKQGRIKIKN